MADGSAPNNFLTFEARMRSTSTPRLLPLALLAALAAAGCGGRKSGAPETEPAPAPRTTASSSTVTADEMRPMANEPIEKVLQGRISGVDVTTGPDGGIAVRIRGATSGGSSEPLYVIDGVAVQPGPGGSLSGISAYDIESIRVLKDPADLTMYGSRGANGVIVVKTKKARKARQ